MPVFAGDTVRLSFFGRCFAQRIIFDLSYRVTVGNAVATTAAALGELISEVNIGGGAGNQIVPSYLACLPPQYTLEEIRAQVIKPVRSSFVRVSLAGVVGTNVNPATVACDSGAITRRTPLAGRRQVSVLKVGPLPDGASAAGVLTAGQTALMSTLGTDTIKGLLLPVTTIQLVSTILSPAGDHDSRDLTGFFIGPTSRVMNRRVVGRGE